jgi:hypothetical protein
MRTFFAWSWEALFRLEARWQHMGRPPKLNPRQQKETRRQRAEGATFKELGVGAVSARPLRGDGHHGARRALGGVVIVAAVAGGHMGALLLATDMTWHGYAARSMIFDLSTLFERKFQWPMSPLGLPYLVRPHYVARLLLATHRLNTCLLTSSFGACLWQNTTRYRQDFLTR